MSVLVVGLNHKGAPLATLERVALVGDALDKLLHDVFRADDVAGALVLSTCNRVEIYAEVGKFHGAVAAICELLSRHSQVPQAELTQYLYVHYEDRAQQHMLAVACGLDSMVVGESQILGQLRQALRIAREKGTLGPTLSALGSRALRAGKRAQSETRVGQTGASLVSVGLQTAARHLGASGRGPPGPTRHDCTAALAGRARRPCCRCRSDERAGCSQRGQGGGCQHRRRQPDPAAGRAAGRIRRRPGGRHIRPDRPDRGGRPRGDVHRRGRPCHHARHGAGRTGASIGERGHVPCRYSGGCAARPGDAAGRGACRWWPARSGAHRPGDACRRRPGRSRGRATAALAKAVLAKSGGSSPRSLPPTPPPVARRQCPRLSWHCGPRPRA